MKRHRGRAIAIWSAAICLVVVLAACVALRGRIVEEYWLWRLERGKDEEKAVAAERLGELRSMRAVQPLEELLSWDPMNDPIKQRRIGSYSKEAERAHSASLYGRAAEALRRIRGE